QRTKRKVRGEDQSLERRVEFVREVDFEVDDLYRGKQQRGRGAGQRAAGKCARSLRSRALAGCVATLRETFRVYSCRPLYHSTVRRKPSSKETFTVYPNPPRAASIDA